MEESAFEVLSVRQVPGGEVVRGERRRRGAQLSQPVPLSFSLSHGKGGAGWVPGYHDDQYINYWDQYPSTGILVNFFF